MVPESQNLEAFSRQPGIALPVILAVVMLTTIGLDDQSSSEVNEVDYIGANGLLAPKLLAAEPVASQIPPQLILSIGHVRAQILCAGLVLLHHT